MSTLWPDGKFALRQLLKSPGFTAVAVLTLALGIGANTAIFSMVKSVLLSPLPFEHGEKVVHLGHREPAPGVRDVTFSVLEMQDYVRQSRTLAGLTEYHSMTYALVGQGDPDQVRTGVVSANFFDEMGVRPILGRSFRREDDLPGAPPVIVLTNEYWRSRFGGDPGILGQSLRMNNRAIEVVGVLPPLPAYPQENDVFISTAACPFRSSDRALHRREMRMLNVFGRLKPGVSLAAAQAEVNAIANRLHAAYPDIYRRDDLSDVPLVPVREELIRGFRTTGLVLLVTVGLVLLIGCANLANLTIARLLSREREVVVRAALGAGRGLIVRQLLIESLLLSLTGGLLGVLLAQASMRLLVAFTARFTPRASEVGIDVWVLLFALGVSVATGLVFGCFPALQVSRQDLASALREGNGHATLSPGGHRARGALIVFQVGLSFVLLIGAGLTVRSLLKLQQVSMGVDPTNVMTMTFTLPFSKYTRPPEVLRFFEQIDSRLSELPGVISVAGASENPLEGPSTPHFKIDGRVLATGEKEPEASLQVVSGEYFHTLAVPVLAGRPFTVEDKGQNLVAVVNRSMARQFWPNESPIGKRIALTTLGAGTWRTIVGVVGDVKQNGLQVEARPGFYCPIGQMPLRRFQVFLRAVGDPVRLAGDVRAVVRTVDPEQPVANLQTLEQVKSAAIAPSRLTATLLGLFAVLAFVITATGVSAVVAFFVNERTQEIGIRSALGASRGDVIALVLRQILVLVGLGLALGALGSIFLSRFLASLLFGVEPTDPLTFVTVALVLLTVVGIACLVPARRAVRIDPIMALRS